MPRGKPAARTTALAAAAALLPVPAAANVYLPSLVQMIEAPLLWSVYLFTMAVTVPALLAVGFTEALVVRRYAKGASLGGLTLRLTALNALTSLVGLVAFPSGAEIWPGLLVAYAASVLLEAPLLNLAGRGLLAPRRFRRTLRISAEMNAASYALLGAVLAGLTYLPTLGTDDRAVAGRAHGRILVATRIADLGVLSLDAPSRKLVPETAPDVVELLGRAGDGDRVLALVAGREAPVCLSRSAGAWQAVALPWEPAVGGVSGTSPDGRLLCSPGRGRWVVYDVPRWRVLRRLPAGIGNPDETALDADGRFLLAVTRHTRDEGDRVLQVTTAVLTDLSTGASRKLAGAPSGGFSPAEPLLAWHEEKGAVVLYDCRTGATRRLRVPGSCVSPLAWSPDGRLLAYLGHPNRFTAQGWYPELRVLDTRTGKSATLLRSVTTYGAPGVSLLWLP